MNHSSLRPVITAVLACGVALAIHPSHLCAQGPQQPRQQEAQPQIPPQRMPTPAVPNDNGVLVLIQTTLIALNQANATSNYTVFRELGSSDFQTSNSTAKLAEIFADLRQKNIDMSAILLLRPKLLSKPMIDPQGMLRVTGFFPTYPFQVNFDLLFQPVEAQWRLFGISVGTSRAQPVAIEPQPAPVQSPNASAPVTKQAPAAPSRKQP
jgi:hypothetical protein